MIASNICKQGIVLLFVLHIFMSRVSAETAASEIETSNGNFRAETVYPKSEEDNSDKEGDRYEGTKIRQFQSVKANHSRTKHRNT